MRVFRVFMASSFELYNERVSFANFLTGVNNMYDSANISFLLDKWEYLSSDWVPGDKQEQYNAVLRKSDLCLVLLWKKIGPFTQREFDAAVEERKREPKTKRLYVHFKQIEDRSCIEPKELEALDSFAESTYGQYGNWGVPFKNDESFHLRVLQDIIIYLQETGVAAAPLTSIGGKIDVGGNATINLQNVAFVSNNDEYKLICSNIQTTEALLACLSPDDERYQQYAPQLYAWKKKKEEMENHLLETSLVISRMSYEKCSERLKRAIQLFESGDSRGAMALLDEEDTASDVRSNLRLVKTGKEMELKGREGLQVNLKEYLLLIQLLLGEMSKDWKERIKRLFVSCFSIGEENLKKDQYVDLLTRCGSFYSYIGEHEEALRYREMALNKALSLYGEQHHEVAKAYNNLGVTCNALGKYSEAFRYGNLNLEICLSLYGENNPSVATAYNNLGTTFYDLEIWDTALKYQQKALDVFLSVYEERTPEVADVLNNIGCTLEEMGEYEKALEYEMKSLGIKLSIYGEQNAEVAALYSNIGCCLGHLKENDKALENELKALGIYKSLFGDNHPDVANTLNSIGCTFDDMDMDEKALVFKQKALNINLSLTGERSADVATLYNNIACSYENKGDYDKALELKLKAANILTSLFGEESILVAKIYNSLSITYAYLKQADIGMEYFEKSKHIRATLLEKIVKNDKSSPSN